MTDARAPHPLSQAGQSKTLVPMGVTEENRPKRLRMRTRTPKVRTGCKTWYIVVPSTLVLLLLFVVPVEDNIHRI